MRGNLPRYVYVLLTVCFVLVMTVVGCDSGPQPTVSPLPTASPLQAPGGGVAGVEPVSFDGGDTMDFSDVVVNGIPLVILIVGLVQFIREMGISGKALRATSAGIGLLVGLAYQMSLGVPVDFAGWFGAVLYGLGLGVVASGLVDQARNLAERVR